MEVGEMNIRHLNFILILVLDMHSLQNLFDDF